MRSRGTLGTFVLLISFLFAQGTSAQADTGSLSDSADFGSHGCSESYYAGDSRLGPDIISNELPVVGQLADYRRTGSLSAPEFLEKYWDPTETPTSPVGSYRYPPKEGYVLDSNGAPMKTKGQLDLGAFIDRYGSEGGNFLSPAGTSYSDRALPPSNLISTPADFCNYHAYIVIKKLPVYEGPIAPWFEQRGFGTQFQIAEDLFADLHPPTAICGSKYDVMWLQCAGYVRPIYPLQ